MFVPPVPEELESIPPGAELAQLLASLDWEHLSDYDLLRALRAQDRQISHYQAGRSWTMNRIAEVYEEESRGWAVGREALDGAAAEIGAALRLTRRSSESQTDFSIALCRHRPEVFEALLFGRIDMARARILVEATLALSDAEAHGVLEQILPDARMLTTGQLRHKMQKLCVDTNPESAKKQFASSFEDRMVVLEPNLSGTANLKGLNLDPAEAAAVKQYIHSEAMKLKRHGDRRTIDQIRADIYIDLLKGRHLGSHGSGKSGGIHLDVTIDTLTKLSEQSGEIEGFGPVVADVARQIAHHQTNADWTWTLRDPDTGLPIDGGTTRRRPTTAQARHVRAHDRTCVHPGCRMPAVQCDIDHRIPWHERRVTCTGDLAPLCKHHHVVRHTWGWTYRPLANGDWVFTTPLGHRHTTSGRRPP